MLFHRRCTGTGRYRRGQLVEVRSPQEIARTLDSDGKLQGVPFMPEMAQFCGRLFRVHRRAEKTCVETGGMIRRMQGAVLLGGVRCDGSAHEGCDRGCLIFWKEAWLKAAPTATATDREIADADLLLLSNLPVLRSGRFLCQSTDLRNATSPLPWWDARQYVRDLWLGQATLSELTVQLWLLAWNKMWRILRSRRTRAARGNRRRTQTVSLDLRSGDLVEVKSKAEIEATLSADSRNRGLAFSPDMAKHCGKTYRVARRVDKIIVEGTGQMRSIANTVILEQVACDGKHARGCPRANYYYWREIWLKKVDQPNETATTGRPCSIVAGEMDVPAATIERSG